jgi:hypothetical protein
MHCGLVTQCAFRDFAGLPGDIGTASVWISFSIGPAGAAMQIKHGGRNIRLLPYG